MTSSRNKNFFFLACWCFMLYFAIPVFPFPILVSYIVKIGKLFTANGVGSHGRPSLMHNHDLKFDF